MTAAYFLRSSVSVRIGGEGGRDEPARNAQTQELITGGTAEILSVKQDGVELPGLTLPIPFTESPLGVYWATIPAADLAIGSKVVVEAQLVDSAGGGGQKYFACEAQVIAAC